MPTILSEGGGEVSVAEGYPLGSAGGAACMQEESDVVGGGAVGLALGLEGLRTSFFESNGPVAGVQGLNAR